jgi:hypothetical protein
MSETASIQKPRLETIRKTSERWQQEDWNDAERDEEVCPNQALG